MPCDQYKPGDPPPEGYNAWHEWARVQVKSGLEQTQCPDCGKWRFPQEFASTGRCLECAGA